MPIPQDLDPSPAEEDHDLMQIEVKMRRPSEESMRAEDCEGPVHDALMETENAATNRPSSTNVDTRETYCSDRAELIERLKRGESPTWIPNQSLQQEYFKANGEEIPIRSAITKPVDATNSLLPAPEIRGLAAAPTDTFKDPFSDLRSQAMEIQRPRSALHSGDFDEQSPTKSRDGPTSTVSTHPDMTNVEHSDGPLGTSPTSPWYKPSSSFQSRASDRNFFRERDYDMHGGAWTSRSRAPSVGSFSSSSFVLKAPTTPLVQQSNNTDLDFPSRDRSISPDKSSRRHTLPPNALYNLQTSANASTSDDQFSPWQSTQGDSRFPLGHTQRRSLTSTWSLQHPSSPPNSLFARSRRTSFSSEASPLQHASMVGSYEESILRGRMSTAPSKPLDFTAQIGVLGKGSCKPKCPPHVTIPFPAVYYCWSAGQGRRPVNDEPSPYVGQIDLQQPSTTNSPSTPSRDSGHNPSTDLDVSDYSLSHDANPRLHERHGEKGRVKKRRQTSPSSTPPKGSYRIPEQGQLQIVIKNPNKTAVKLFLVPYDLSGMEAGTKTFIRQRLLSAGPIIERPLLSTTSPRSSISLDTNHKQALRYLIHLNICCPSKGRFYLYQHIRVVFANRVPDSKEQLRTETQIPEPRFSIWKPSSLIRQPSSAGAKLTAEKAFRRRSSGFAFGEDIRAPWSTGAFSGGASFPFLGDSAPPVPPIPFHLPRSQTHVRHEDRLTEPMDVDSSRPTTASDMQSPNSHDAACRGCMQIADPLQRVSSQGSNEYEKLNRGDAGYGGLFNRPTTPEPGEGLLARKLKNLDVQRNIKTEMGT